MALKLSVIFGLAAILYIIETYSMIEHSKNYDGMIVYLDYKYHKLRYFKMVLFVLLFYILPLYLSQSENTSHLVGDIESVFYNFLTCFFVMTSVRILVGIRKYFIYISEVESNNS